MRRMGPSRHSCVSAGRVPIVPRRVLSGRAVGRGPFSRAHEVSGHVGDREAV